MSFPIFDFEVRTLKRQAEQALASARLAHDEAAKVAATAQTIEAVDASGRAGRALQDAEFLARTVGEILERGRASA